MEFLVPFLIPPAAFAAFMAALYYIYPYPLVHGYKRFGGYLIAGLRRKFIKVNDITYCYYEREPVISSADKAAQHHTDENGHPKTVLFLHGYTGNKTMWITMVRYFPKEWRLILLDLPGHGETTFQQDGKYHSAGFAEKLHEFVTAMDFHNLHLVGCSLGALVSASYASVHSQYLKSITLMCPPVAHKLPQGVKTQYLEALEKGHNMVLPKNAEEFRDMLKLVAYDASRYTFHNRMTTAIVEDQMSNYPYFVKIQQDLMDGRESVEYIKSMAGNISVPVFILWGEDDRVCHPSGALIMSQLLKDDVYVQVTVLERCGHAMTMDRPRKCSKLICNFVSRETEM